MSYISAERLEVKARLQGAIYMLQPSTQSQCLQFASAYYAFGFPRELRDLMYTHLVTPPYYYFTRIGFLSPGYVTENMKTTVCGHSTYMQPSHHALNPAYVGQAMALEIAEAYYSQNIFDVTKAKYLSRLLLTDYHGLGIKPYEWIREVRLSLKFGKQDSRPEDELETLKKTYAHMRNLCFIRQKNRLKVDIYVHTTFHGQIDDDANVDKPRSYQVDHERRVLNVLEMLRQPVYDLLHAGSKISLVHFNNESIEDAGMTAFRSLTRHGGLHGADSVTVVDFFCKGKEEWDEERTAHDPWDPTRNYIFPDTQPASEHDGGTEDEFGERFDWEEGKMRKALRERWGMMKALDGFEYENDLAQMGEGGSVVLNNDTESDDDYDDEDRAMMIEY